MPGGSKRCGDVPPATSADGYTLAEMLVALAVLGLALGGFAAGVRSLGRDQAVGERARLQADSQQTASEAVASLLDGHGPFASDAAGTFDGAGSRFSFACGADPCEASIVSVGAHPALMIVRGAARQTIALNGPTSARFVYVGSLATLNTWPPPAKPFQALREVVLLGRQGAGETPIAVGRIWPDETADCIFDAIDGICRSPHAP